MDDASDMSHLGEELETYMSQYPKVRVETSHWSRSIQTLHSHWIMALHRQLFYSIKNQLKSSKTY